MQKLCVQSSKANDWCVRTASVRYVQTNVLISHCSILSVNDRFRSIMVDGLSKMYLFCHSLSKFNSLVCCCLRQRKVLQVIYKRLTKTQQYVPMTRRITTSHRFGKCENGTQ